MRWSDNWQAKYDRVKRGTQKRNNISILAVRRQLGITMWHTARSPKVDDLLKEIGEQKDCRLCFTKQPNYNHFTEKDIQPRGVDQLPSPLSTVRRNSRSFCMWVHPDAECDPTTIKLSSLAHGRNSLPPKGNDWITDCKSETGH